MNKTLKTICLSILSGICISGLAGAEIFVSPNGKDSSSGVKNAPLKTIGKAVAKAKPGEKCLDLGTGNGIIPILMEAKTKGDIFYGRW